MHHLPPPPMTPSGSPPPDHLCGSSCDGPCITYRRGCPTSCSTSRDREKGYLKWLQKEDHMLCKVRHPVQFYSSISRRVGSNRDEVNEGKLGTGKDGSGYGGAREHNPHLGHRWLPLLQALYCPGTTRKKETFVGSRKNR
jgi:hypothetical protein